MLFVIWVVPDIRPFLYIRLSGIRRPDIRSSQYPIQPFNLNRNLFLNGVLTLVEVAAALNVDYSHVEGAANQIAKSDRDMHLILGKPGWLVGWLVDWLVG